MDDNIPISQVIRMEINEYREKRRFIEKQHEQKSFRRHLFIYIISNVTFGIIFFFLDKLWMISFPVFFWGIGILIHYIKSVLKFDDRFEKQEDLIREL
ncbi:MAG: 2TM domain-containing protein [Candidatus Syntropharchaeales archaeon]